MMEVTPNPFNIILMILTLAIGGGQDQNQVPWQPDVDMAQYVPYRVPLYICLDVQKLRENNASYLELIKILTGKSKEEAFQNTLKFMSDEFAVSEEKVYEAFCGPDGVKRIGFWLLGFGKDYPQILLVFDRGPNAKDVLSQFLAKRSDSPSYYSFKYAGSAIHLFANDTYKGDGVWVTEKKGKIAFALDPITVQKFLLRTYELENISPDKKYDVKSPLLDIQAYGDPVCSGFLASLSSYERYDFMTVFSFLDLAAWESMKITYDGNNLSVDLKIKEKSSIWHVLENSLAKMSDKKPGFLSYVNQETPIAATVNLKDAKALWKHVNSVINQVTALKGRPEDAKKVRDDFLRETGLDIEKDLIDNVRGLGFIFPDLKNHPDLPCLIFESNDPVQARASIENFVKKMSHEDSNVLPRNYNDVILWETDTARIALHGNNVIIFDRRFSFEDIWAELNKTGSEFTQSLYNRYPSAQAFFLFNPNKLAQSRDNNKHDIILIGITWEDSTLKIGTQIDLGKLIQSIAQLK